MAPTCPRDDERASLSEMYQAHQQMLATQRSLQEGMTNLVAQLHAVSQENIQLHEELLTVRRAHKTLRAEHAATLEQLNAACKLNLEAELKLRSQAQQLLTVALSGCPTSAGHQGLGSTAEAEISARCQSPCQAVPRCLKQSQSAAGKAASPPPPTLEGEEDDDAQESGFFAGLDLIGEAIEQMESEERSRLGSRAELSKGSGGSDMSAKHSAASTPEVVDLRWPAESGVLSSSQQQQYASLLMNQALVLGALQFAESRFPSTAVSLPQTASAKRKAEPRNVGASKAAKSAKRKKC